MNQTFLDFFEQFDKKTWAGAPVGESWILSYIGMPGIKKRNTNLFFLYITFYSMFVWAPVKFYTALKLRKKSTVYKLQLTNHEMSISQKGSVTKKVCSFLSKTTCCFRKALQIRSAFLDYKIFFLKATPLEKF